jgi:hypothetical protein
MISLKISMFRSLKKKKKNTDSENDRRRDSGALAGF